MPRTKGAKNKTKPVQWYLDELAKLGVKAEVDGKVPPELPPVTEDETPPETPPKVTKSKAIFDIKKPAKKTPPPNIEGEVYRCGNPACGKILTGAISPCPFCGAVLQWES